MHCQPEKKNPYWVIRIPAGCQALGTYYGSGTLLTVGHIMVNRDNKVSELLTGHLLELGDAQHTNILKWSNRVTE